MRIKDEICSKCSMPNFYDITFKHYDPAIPTDTGSPLQKYCTYCKAELKG